MTVAALRGGTEPGLQAGLRFSVPAAPALAARTVGKIGATRNLRTGFVIVDRLARPCPFCTAVPHFTISLWAQCAIPTTFSRGFAMSNQPSDRPVVPSNPNPIPDDQTTPSRRFPSYRVILVN